MTVAGRPNRDPPPRRSRGYTLVEVLVAVTVFAFLAGAAYIALDGLSRAALDHRERARDFGDLQLAVARLDADLRQLASRPVRGPDGTPEPALAGTRTALAGTRAGWSNPSDQRRGHLQRFTWQLSGTGELVRSHYPVTDRVPGSQLMSEALLEDVSRLAFRYRDADGRWLDDWPDTAGELTRLPVAIEVSLESERFGPVRRLVVLQ